jgi:hypothetical protein
MKRILTVLLLVAMLCAAGRAAVTWTYAVDRNVKRLADENGNNYAIQYTAVIVITKAPYTCGDALAGSIQGFLLNEGQRFGGYVLTGSMLCDWDHDGDPGTGPVANDTGKAVWRLRRTSKIPLTDSVPAAKTLIKQDIVRFMRKLKRQYLGSQASETPVELPADAQFIDTADASSMATTDDPNIVPDPNTAVD